MSRPARSRAASARRTAPAGRAPREKPVAPADSPPLLTSLLPVILTRWTEALSQRGLQRGEASGELLREGEALLGVLAECLESGRYHAAQRFAETMAARDVYRGLGAKQAIERLLVLRDVCARSLTEAAADPAAARRLLDAYEPVINRLFTVVTVAFLQEREQAVGEGRERLEALVDAGMLLAAERSLESVLQRIVEVACRLLMARYGALGVFDAAGRLEHFVTTGLGAAAKSRIDPPPQGRGILGLLLREAKPVRLRDLMRDPRAVGFPARHPAMRSFLGVPIMSRGRVFGSLYVTEKRGAEEFSPEDERLAVTLAAQAAVAIENTSLYEQLHRSYEELKHSQDLLIRQEKLASLGRLAAGVAHELNNPLASVAGFAEALTRRMTGGSPAGCAASGDCQEYLGMIQAEVARAAAIVRRLLDFARRREPAFGPVGLAGVVADAIAFVGRQASLTNRRIEVRPFPEDCTVQGDLPMLQQLFLNLLTNALDAIEGGGEITIAARRLTGGQLGDQASRQSGGGSPLVARSPDRLSSTPKAWVEVSVSDTGVGIASEDLPRLFDPFFTTKEVGKGTGLGLAISQSIVEQHGGRIEIASPGPGRGATVTVRLPLAK